MVIVHVVGGLGNQLYCYAMYRLQKSLGKAVKLDISDYLPDAKYPEKRELDLLKLMVREPAICTKEERYRFTDDCPLFFSKVRRKLVGAHISIYPEKTEYDPEIMTIDNIWLDGYWNCEKYYEAILDEIRDCISFPQNSSAKNDEYVKKMEQEVSCAIHLRRTDYLDPSCVDRYKDICTEQYYRKALELVKTRNPEVSLYVFSDDLDYAKEFFKEEENVTFVDWNRGDDSLYDMMLMSKCKYHICANSTFSMWGARLSKREHKMMIRPSKHDNYQKVTDEEMKDQWKKWILIDPEGKQL